MQDKDILFENLMSECISGSISDKDKAELFALIADSEIYKARYDEMAKLYAILHLPTFEAQKEDNYKVLKERLQFTSPRLSGRKWYIYARNIAAVILLLVSVSVGSVFTYSHLEDTGDLLYNEMTVPLGSQTKVVLPDGSVAVLNSGSVLKYPLSYGKKERNVYLVGEGYFEVAKNKEKVFQVHAEGMTIKVTGTIFNVRSYLEDHATEISLLEGGVDVFANNRSLRLKPNEKAIYNRKTGMLYSEATEAGKAALWTTGRLSFVNSSIVDLLKDIERKYNVKIYVESKQAENEYFSGSISLNMSLQEVFNFIDVDKKYHFEMSGNTIILKDK